MTTQSAESHPTAGGAELRRLLFVADAGVADVDELPPPVRALIEQAADVYVMTPSLPARLDWLADQVDPSRRAADERLDRVLGHVRAIGAHATGTRGADSLLAAFADAIAEFHPDHILIALRSSEHANWQERGLIEHVRERFGLPITTFAVDQRGHVASS